MTEKEEYVYEPFAETEEYKKVNGDITGEWIKIMLDQGIERIDRIMDIATGVGTMVQLFFSNLPDNLKSAEVVCLDQSSEALRRAREKLDGQISRLDCINSKVQDLEMEGNSFDVVIWGNGIHYLSEDEQHRSLENIRKGVKDDGWLFFNTAFYEGSRPKETLSFYRSQVKNAVQSLRKRGIGRDKERIKVEAASFHPRQYYEDLIESTGFKLVEASEYAANLSKEAWEYISSFQQYAAGALDGYPVEEAAVAMKEAVATAIEAYGSKSADGNPFVTRNWLSISARS